MKTEKVRLIEWFIDFAYVDIDELPMGEKIKLWMEYFSIYAGGVGISGENISDDDMGYMLHFLTKHKSLDHLPGVQENFKDNFFSMMEKIRNNEQDLLSMQVRYNVKTITIGGTVQTTYDTNTNVLEEYTDLLMLRFLQSLNGIATGAFHQCPECNKWFINVSKRNKIFCSNRCAARKGSREIRSRNGEKLKAASKKRAKKSYARKMASRGYKKYQEELDTE
jgi:hypothetical protein